MSRAIREAPLSRWRPTRIIQRRKDISFRLAFPRRLSISRFVTLPINEHRNWFIRDLFPFLCLSLSFFLSRQKNLIGQCRGMISAIERSSTFLLSRMYKKKRNFAFKLDVDTLNESGGNSVFRGNWGGGGSIRVKLKKFPK